LKDKFNLGIAGNIGVGKTTLTEKLSNDLGFSAIYESVIDNPYLSDFYNDMSRWSFNLQIYFLYTRFESQVKLLESNSSFIQDRTIYEDKEIFASNLVELGHMSDRDFKTYCEIFNAMLKFIREPDLIIYLQANTDTLMSRIKNRKRDYELDISSEYIHSLNIYYDRWINKLPKKDVLIVRTDDFDVFNDKEFYNNIVNDIKDRIYGK
jgi:deoxyadenosine/deoxycytidine kinase